MTSETNERPALDTLSTRGMPRAAVTNWGDVITPQIQQHLCDTLSRTTSRAAGTMVARNGLRRLAPGLRRFMPVTRAQLRG